MKEPMPRYETFCFNGLEGFNIFCRRWHPEGEPRAVLVILHGYAEHSGRYQHVAEYFVSLGYIVYALDHRGHGQSDGVRADVVRFEDFLGDLGKFLRIVKAREPDLQIFLIGHSLGAAIATLFAARYGTEFDGLVTSGVGISILVHRSPMLAKFIKTLAKLVPPFYLSYRCP